ncbi:MAG: SpoIIE family protein phosphatase, partial [Clostridia bacterium]|nr:SpoIIE family protein phosphatase [Clostridia bacterium]
GQDEFAMISSAFNSMTDDIDKYIDNINSLAEEQSNRNAELNIASKIQFGMLPKEEFNSWYADVNAVMLPAKEVGGDFYLYLPLDNSKMLTAIADVSGKGISAAMLMSITLTLMREYAKMGLSPAEILEKANNTIANNNSANFFVTAFVGIYDAKKCEYTYANAGHNVPFLINEKFTCLDGNLGTVLGLFEDEEYEETTVKVQSGDRIYLYTDGVTESINEDKDFYGVEQLISVLKQDGNCIENIKNSIFEFRGEAEQFDDITMMEIKFRSDIDLSLDYNKKELKKIKNIILDTPLERNDQLNLYLSIEELFVNICSYAFDGEAPEGEKIDFNLSVNKDVVVTLKDGGQEFNPLEDIADIEDYDIDTMIGGLGRFLAVNGVDDSSYERVDNKNVLTIIKHIPEEK